LNHGPLNQALAAAAELVWLIARAAESPKSNMPIDARCES
jgi:hypothetical protein